MARLLCALLLIACTEPPPERDATSLQISAYQMQQRQIDIVARRYDMGIAAITDSPELCISMHRAYDRDVRVSVFQLAQLDSGLDEAITAHGGPADLACTTAALQAELDHHGAVACQAEAVADNQAEATRHLIALRTLMEHAAARLAEIEAGLASDAESWTWSLPARCP